MWHARHCDSTHTASTGKELSDIRDLMRFLRDVDRANRGRYCGVFCACSREQSICSRQNSHSFCLRPEGRQEAVPRHDPQRLPRSDCFFRHHAARQNLEQVLTTCFIPVACLGSFLWLSLLVWFVAWLPGNFGFL